MGTIIEEIKAGNKNAVKAIYQEYAKDVYNFAKSITGDHDSALAATKKTFGKLVNNIKKGEEPENIRTSLLKIAYDEACGIAMPSLNTNQKEEKVPEIESKAEKVASKSTRRIHDEKATEIEEKASSTKEEIYMPDSGEDAFKVEEDAEETPEIAPRRRRLEGEAAPHRRRPSAEGEEGPRRRRLVSESEEDVSVRPRRRRPIEMEETPDVASSEEKIEVVEENIEAPKQNRKARPVREEKAVDVYDALEEETDYDNQYDAANDSVKHRSKGLFIFCIILNIVLILILLWFLGGLLVNLGVLPSIDLGYTWFNNHIYPLF